MTHPININNHNNQETSQDYLHEQQVNTFLSQCGLTQYYVTFIDEGFDRLDSLLEITESDLIHMQVKRGHRRLLQRAIFNIKGIPSKAPLNIAPIGHSAEHNEDNGFNSSYQKELYDQSIQSLEVLDLLSDTSTANNSGSNTNDNKHTHSTHTPINNHHHHTNHHHHSNNNHHHHPSLTDINDNLSPNSTSSSNKSKSPNSIVNCSIIALNSSSSNSSASSNPMNQYHHHDYFPSASTMTHNSHSGMSSTEEEAVTNDNVHRMWKRKYHRHAKSDPNAPVKPPSAYVMFSNDIRSELKKENYKFTDLAKIIGDRWKNIPLEDKERYEKIASAAREDYLKKTSDYQRTEPYRQYQAYLRDFKSENEAAARPVGRPKKRQKKLDVYCMDELMEANEIDIVSTNEPRNSISSDQRQYPYYLLNDDATQKAATDKKA